MLDNHDTVGRLVRVELSGPLARYTKPRRQPRLDLQSRRQQEITLEVRPEETRPEGGHAYDLHAVVIDDKLETVVYTCSARIGVERFPQLATRAERSSPHTVTDRGVVQLRVHVRNSGNVPLLVDAQRVNHAAAGCATTTGARTSGCGRPAGRSGPSGQRRAAHPGAAAAAAGARLRRARRAARRT